MRAVATRQLHISDNFTLINENGISAPDETLPVLTDGYAVAETPELSLTDANIGTVIWATGYSFDFSLVHLPVFDRDGYPIQERGVIEQPGLYFVGLPWLHNAKSGLLFGLAQDASHIAAALIRSRDRKGASPIVTLRPEPLVACPINHGI